ncbi:uncharacterized protein LOC133742823 [Rosa rugosa]|uniref:uncharacterized protein LOC133742823 n=1 Tax=Rosa rugosa TaxID=74645 RepID=UPI002B40E3F1|nr:uncharacterized protein LOC133742823 [Rosa rugosa]
MTSVTAEGLPFTWSNKHRDNTVIYERLDRVTANPNWFQLFPDCTLQNLPIVGSDHGPILLTTLSRRKPSRRPFKLEAIWFAHPQFVEITKHIWNMNWDNDPIKNLSAILGAFSHRISNWSRETYGNLFRNLGNLQKDLQFYQSQLMISPTSLFLQDKVVELTEQFLELEKAEEVFWAQRAKANWLCLGDKNTKFFQTQATLRKKRNYINKIKNNMGIWFDKHEDISHVFIQDFQMRFRSDNSFNRNVAENFIKIIEPVISDADNISLLRRVTPEEIQLAVNSIGGLKQCFQMRKRRRRRLVRASRGECLKALRRSWRSSFPKYYNNTL